MGQWDSPHDRSLPRGWPGGSQTGRNRDAFSRDHFQRAGETTPYGRDGPAYPRFVQRWSSPVDGGCGEARWTFPASHSDTIEVDDVARPSCRNRYGSARPEAPVYSGLRVPDDQTDDAGRPSREGDRTAPQIGGIHQRLRLLLMGERVEEAAAKIEGLTGTDPS